MRAVSYETIQKALDGDKAALLAVLAARGVEHDIITLVASLHPSRARDEAAFANLVAARVHYIKRGWLGISKSDRIKELESKFDLKNKGDTAKHIANGKGYEAVRAEAQRQIKREAEEGNPTD
jgi:hypothetical protein